MRRSTHFGVALFTLACAWGGLFQRLLPGGFSAHMAVHMMVVAVAAPLLAYALAGSRADPVVARPNLFPPVPASVLELLVVWSFHTPALHHWARHSLSGRLCEQAAFLISALYVWLAALGGGATLRDQRRAAGVIALLLTSMHMTLLGALIALATRTLYAHHGHAIGDQQLGGAVMLLFGGSVYLAGGVALSARFVRTLD